MKKIILAVSLMIIVTVFTGCDQADRVSHNLSKEADNFNVARRLTVINTRAEDGNDAILYQMTGNFSIEKEYDGDLAVIGENPDGTYYKHFVYLSRDISYITEQLVGEKVGKYKFVVNYNPQMLIPADVKVIE